PHCPPAWRVQPFRVPVRHRRGGLGRKLRQYRAPALDDARVALPAEILVRIGSEQEAIGVLQEERPPLGAECPAFVHQRISQQPAFPRSDRARFDSSFFERVTTTFERSASTSATCAALPKPACGQMKTWPG